MPLRIFGQEFLPVLAIAMPIRPIRTHPDHGRSIWIIMVDHHDHHHHHHHDHLHDHEDDHDVDRDIDHDDDHDDHDHDDHDDHDHHDNERQRPLCRGRHDR